jgi:hypothetical protein
MHSFRQTLVSGARSSQVELLLLHLSTNRRTKGKLLENK